MQESDDIYIAIVAAIEKLTHYYDKPATPEDVSYQI
jgi:hypothetical protein